MSSPLIDVEHLDALIGDPRLVLLDIRWALPGGADRQGYLEGHLPGARFIDLDQELADPPGRAGRHPLPAPARFQGAMRRAGVSQRSLVVAYDAGSGAAARCWWLLQAGGHPDALVLDGGLGAWSGSGGTLEAGEREVAPGDLEVRRFSGSVSAEETEALLARGGVVLDARSRERYRGDPSPLDPRPGHIPGATSLPWTDAYSEGRVRPAAEIRRLAPGGAQGGAPEVAYCGSGVTACSLILALEAAGVMGVRLYPGSWSEWAQDPERPAELGGGVTPGG